MVSELLILSALYWPVAFGVSPRFTVTEGIVMTVAGIIAYGIATILSFEVAAEYRQARWARLAWQLLAVSFAFSLIKRTIGSPLFEFIQVGYRSSPLRGLLDNLLLIPANLCLVAGLLAMWWAMHRLGLGFKIERRDYVAMAAVAALFVTLLITRESLSQGQSPFLLSRVLQPAALGLLGIGSAFGVVLHRYAVQMGDGRLAAVMRWLMLFVVLRGALVLLRSVLSPKLPLLLDTPTRLEEWVIEVLWQAVHWAAALAVACRAQLTVTAARDLQALQEPRAAKTQAVAI